MEKVSKVDDTDDSEDSEVMTGRIKEVTVRSVSGVDKTEVTVRLTSPTGMGGDAIRFLTDTGVKRTILNWKDWDSLRKVCELKETKLRFRPYGTEEQLPIQGRARVVMTAGAGAEIQTEVYMNKSEEESLLGQRDAEALWIVVIKPEGATEAVTVSRVL